jgi:hypothetical protein
MNVPFQKKQRENDMISFEGPLDTLKLHLTDIRFSSGYNRHGDNPPHFKNTPISLLTIKKDPEVLGYWELPVSGSKFLTCLA